MPFDPALAPTVLALGALAGLLLIQIIAADVIGILRRHPPGTLVREDPQELLFRASRTVANSNESLGAALLVIGFAWLSETPASWMNILTITYVASRVAYAAAYYSNLALLRSACFGVGIVALLVLLVRAVWGWL